MKNYKSIARKFLIDFYENKESFIRRVKKSNNQVTHHLVNKMLNGYMKNTNFNIVNFDFVKEATIHRQSGTRYVLLPLVNTRYLRNIKRLIELNMMCGSAEIKDTTMIKLELIKRILKERERNGSINKHVNTSTRSTPESK